MSKQLILCLICLMSFSFLCSHEGHKGMDENEPLQQSVHPTQGSGTTIKQFGGRPQSWMQWIGSFHFILLHFPITLIAMTAVSELLFAFYKRLIFDYASRFMLIAAAILAVPTALLGLTYSYTATYSGLLANFVFWHMWTGLIKSL